MKNFLMRSKKDVSARVENTESSPLKGFSEKLAKQDVNRKQIRKVWDHVLSPSVSMNQETILQLEPDMKKITQFVERRLSSFSQERQGEFKKAQINRSDALQRINLGRSINTSDGAFTDLSDHAEEYRKAYCDIFDMADRYRSFEVACEKLDKIRMCIGKSMSNKGGTDTKNSNRVDTDSNNKDFLTEIGNASEKVYDAYNKVKIDVGNEEKLKSFEQAVSNLKDISLENGIQLDDYEDWLKKIKE